MLAHGNPRATFDIDLVASHAERNLRRLAAALDELNAELAGVDAHLLDVDPTDPDDLSNGANWTMHTDAGKVAFLSEVPGGRPYEEIRQRSVSVEGDGLSFRVVGLDDLIRMKRAAGRDKDLADIAALQRQSGVVGEEFAPHPVPDSGVDTQRRSAGSPRCGRPVRSADGAPCILTRGHGGHCRSR